jgi:hypothetical protein
MFPLGSGGWVTGHHPPTKEIHVKVKLPHALAVAGMSGFLTVAGISLASAQTEVPNTSTIPPAPTTPDTTAPPSTQAPTAPTPPAAGETTPPADDKNCPNMGGDSGASGTGTATNTHGHRGRGPRGQAPSTPQAPAAPSGGSQSV